MLRVEPTPLNAGVTLWGDCNDLGSLSETIHDLVNVSPYREGLSRIPLGLVNDIQQTLADKKTYRCFVESEHEVKYFGCHQVWPLFMFQVRLLRNIASYTHLTKGQKAQLYWLEDGLEQLLIDVCPDIASDCILWLETPLAIDDAYCESYVYEIARRFVVGPQSGLRIKRLPTLLEAFNPLSDSYKAFVAQVDKPVEQPVSGFMW